MVAMGACEKLRVAAAVVSLWVLVAGDVQVGRDSALERQRVAGLEAMIFVCVGVSRKMLMLASKYRVADVAKSTRCFALLSNDDFKPRTPIFPIFRY